MTNKEALKNLCKNCERNINQIPVESKENETYDIHHCGYQMCPFRTISNDYCEEYETLDKAIKDLDFCEKALDYLLNYLDGKYLVTDDENQPFSRLLQKEVLKEDIRRVLGVYG